MCVCVIPLILLWLPTPVQGEDQHTLSPVLGRRGTERPLFYLLSQNAEHLFS